MDDEKFYQMQIKDLTLEVRKFGISWTSYDSWYPDKQSEARRVYLELFKRNPWTGSGYVESIVIEEVFGGKPINNKQMAKNEKRIQEVRKHVQEIMQDLGVDIITKSTSQALVNDSDLKRVWDKYRHSQEKEASVSWETYLKEIEKRDEINEKQADIIREYEKKLRRRRAPEIGFTVAGLAGIVFAALALPKGSSFVDYAISFIAVGLHAYLAYQVIDIIPREYRRWRRGGLSEGQYRFVKKFMAPGTRIDRKRGKMFTPGGRWKDIPTAEAARKQAETTQPHPADEYYD